MKLDVGSDGSRPSDKGVGGGGGVIQTLRKEGAVSKKFFRPFGPQFGLKTRVGLQFTECILLRF